MALLRDIPFSQYGTENFVMGAAGTIPSGIIQAGSISMGPSRLLGEEPTS